MTLSEVLLWNELKQNRLGVDFDRQRPIDNYIVDFYCKDLMLAIEIDGDSHLHPEVAKNDKIRQQRLESLGVRFLRFDDLDVKRDINYVFLTIQDWVEEHKDDLKGREYISYNNKVQESPEAYGLADVKIQPYGDRKGGVVWHTQGSGKSLSMVFFTGKIVLALDNPTVVVITDRNDLDDQLFYTFASSTQLLRQEPKQVENRENLKELLKVASGGVIFTTIQKFQPEEGNVMKHFPKGKI
jgi:very-short-patch-repair endonuclease